MSAATLERIDLENDLRPRSSATSCAATTSRSSTSATDRIVGFEALVRWQHPTRGLSRRSRSSRWPRRPG